MADFPVTVADATRAAGINNIGQLLGIAAQGRVPPQTYAPPSTPVTNPSAFPSVIPGATGIPGNPYAGGISPLGGRFPTTIGTSPYGGGTNPYLNAIWSQLLTMVPGLKPPMNLGGAGGGANYSGNVIGGVGGAVAGSGGSNFGGGYPGLT